MLPTHLRQFGIRHVLAFTVFVAFAFALISADPTFPTLRWAGYSLLGSCFGLLLLWLSNVMDGRSFHQRSSSSLIVNLAACWIIGATFIVAIWFILLATIMWAVR